MINVTPPFVFNSTHIGLSYHKCKKKFCHRKMLANFHIKPPSPYTPLYWEGKQKPCTIKLLSYLVRNNMELYCPCTLLSFVNQKNQKNKKLKFVNENYIYCSEGIIFPNNWSIYCVPILWICRQLKHHQSTIRSEIFILLEIILNAFFNVWQYHFRLKSLFWLYEQMYIAGSTFIKKRLNPLSVIILVYLGNA